MRGRIRIIAILFSSGVANADEGTITTFYPAPAVPDAAASACTATGGQRPPDDFDPLMREWYMRSIGQCDDQLLGCEPGITTLAYGGDRMARYLIHQYESGESIPGCVGAHYLRVLGFTRSPIAIDYLISEIDAPRKPERGAVALGALKYAADQRAIDTAVHVLRDPNRSPLHVIAINVIRANAIKLGRIAPKDLALLQGLETGESMRLSTAATKALKDLERRRIILPPPNPTQS